MAVMDVILGQRRRQVPLKLAGVADVNPRAPGLERARAAGVFTTSDFRDLLTIPGLDLLIELTGDDAVLRDIERQKPPQVGMLDHGAARLFYDLIGLDDERRRAEKRYRDLFELAREGMALTDAEGRILECNFSLAHLMGCSKDEVESKRLHEFAENESEEILRRHLNDLMILGFVSVEMDFVSKSGDPIPVEAGIAWLPEERLFRVMVRDITTQRKLEESRKAYSEKLEQEVAQRTERLKASEEEARRRENFVQNLIMNSIDGIIATGPGGKITIFNHGAVEILGYAPEEIIGRMAYSDILSPETAQAVRESFNADRHGPPGKIIHMETALLGKSGESIPVRLSGALLYEGGQELGSVVFIEDLRETQRLQKEKERSERMAAVGTTVAGLAHYIKNILSGLKGGAYVIGSALAKNDIGLTQQGWGMVERNIDQIGCIVQDMLVYSRDGKPVYERVDPNALVRDVVDLMSEKARTSGVSLRMELDSEVGEAAMDRTAIHRCLLDLVSNAVDACVLEGILSGRGVVTVKTDRPAGSGVRFQVADNGKGMDEATQRRLFSDFFTTKGYRGTGLGLPVTHKIVKDHGGTLTFESRVGHGTVFSLTLPGAAPDESKP